MQKRLLNLRRDAYDRQQNSSTIDSGHLKSSLRAALVGTVGWIHYDSSGCQNWSGPELERVIEPLLPTVSFMFADPASSMLTAPPDANAAPKDRGLHGSRR